MKLAVVITNIINSGILITAVVGLWYANKRYHMDNKYKKSQFYLDEIKQNFSRSISLLVDGNNNNVKWHQAIDLLKISDSRLKNLLIDKTHKEIYAANYIDTAHTIIDIIKRVRSIDFFYGENPKKGLRSNTRMNVDYLKWLCVFVDKATRAQYDLNEKGNSLENIFSSEYFEQVNFSGFLNLNEALFEKDIVNNNIPPFYFIKKYIEQVESCNN